MLLQLYIKKNAIGTLRKPLRAWGNQEKTLRGSAIGGGTRRVIKHPSDRVYSDRHFRKR